MAEMKVLKNESPDPRRSVRCVTGLISSISLLDSTKRKSDTHSLSLVSGKKKRQKTAKMKA